MTIIIFVTTTKQNHVVIITFFTVITLREHQDDTGVAIVSYIEHPEEYQIKDMQKLLQQLEIIEKHTSRPISLLGSNLYI